MEATESAAGQPPNLATESPSTAARRSAFRAVPWRWGVLIIGLSPILLSHLISWLSVGTWLPEPLGWLRIPLWLLSFAWMAAFPTWVVRRRGGGWPRLPRPRSVLVEGSIGLVAMPVVFLIVGLVGTALTIAFGRPIAPGPTFEGVFRSSNRYDPIVLMITAVSLGPVAEELFFRGMLYNALRQRLSIVPAALIQAVLFGLYHHPFDLATKSFIALVGFFLALLYEWRKTLLTPIFLHIFINAVGASMMAWNAGIYADGPMLGVRGGPEANVCRIVEVVHGGAAEVAGLKVEDVITAIDGAPVVNFEQLIEVVASKKAGDRVLVEFDRGGKPLQVEATLKRRRD